MCAHVSVCVLGGGVCFEISLKLLMTGKYKVCSHSKCWMWLWQGWQWTRWHVLLWASPTARQGRHKVFPAEIMMILSSSLPSLPLIYRLPRSCWNNKCRTRCAVICIVVMLLGLSSGHTRVIWCCSGSSHVTGREKNNNQQQQHHIDHPPSLSFLYSNLFL